jgi:hypothetical protein
MTTQQREALIQEARALMSEMGEHADWCYDEAQSASGSGEKAVERSAMKRYDRAARCENVISRLVDAMAATVVREEPAWQPIETAPDDGSWMWVVFGQREPRVTTMRFEAGHGWMSGTGWWNRGGPRPFTYWAPLSERPPALPAHTTGAPA